MLFLIFDGHAFKQMSSKLQVLRTWFDIILHNLQFSKTVCKKTVNIMAILSANGHRVNFRNYQVKNFKICRQNLFHLCTSSFTFKVIRPKRFGHFSENKYHTVWQENLIERFIPDLDKFFGKMLLPVIIKLAQEILWAQTFHLRLEFLNCRQKSVWNKGVSF